MPTRYYLACAHEQFRPDELLWQAVAGEAAGFDGVCCSDHFQPWFEPGESFYGGSTTRVPSDTGGKVLRAIDIQTGRIAWELPQVGNGDTWGGVLSTASGLVFVAEDDISAVQSVEYAVNSGKWTLVFPTDGISDSRQESFDFLLPGYRDGIYTLVIKVTDVLGNTVTARADLR